MSSVVLSRHNLTMTEAQSVINGYVVNDDVQPPSLHDADIGWPASAEFKFDVSKLVRAPRDGQAL